MSKQSLVDLLKSTFLGTNENSSNVMHLLKADHRLVMELFKEFESSMSIPRLRIQKKKKLPKQWKNTSLQSLS